MRKIFDAIKVVLIVIAVFQVVALFSCHTGTVSQPNLPEMVSRYFYDSAIKKSSLILAECEANSKKKDSIVDAVDALVQAYTLEKSLNRNLILANKNLRKRIFIAEFRLGRVDYHLQLVKRNPSKFKPFFQGWTDRDIHYELYLDSNAAFRNYVEGLAAIEIDKELK